MTVEMFIYKQYRIYVCVRECVALACEINQKNLKLKVKEIVKKETEKKIVMKILFSAP